MKLNSFLSNSFFNKSLKESFLSEYLQDDETRESFSIYLAKISEIEHNYNRNIYEFNKDEILDLFIDSKNPIKKEIAQIIFSVSRQYVNWVEKHNPNILIKNPFETLKFKTDILPALEVSEQAPTENQVWEAVKNNNNANETLCLIFPLYGINIEEIINIKKSDINLSTNQITLTSENNSTRVIELPQKVMEHVIVAINQTDYEVRSSKGSYTLPLVDSEYLIRPVALKNKEKQVLQANKMMINSRAKKSLLLSEKDNMDTNDSLESIANPIDVEIKQGDICVINMRGKNRPVLILEISDADIDVIMLTTKVHCSNMFTHVSLDDCGLKEKTKAICEQSFKINRCDILFKAGKCSEKNMTEILEKVSKINQLINK